MSGMKINVELDNRIDLANLSDEFVVFPSLLYSWLQKKTEAERLASAKKAKYEEVKATVLLEIKGGGEKLTVDTVSAKVSIDPRVIVSRDEFLNAEMDSETIKNYVESLRSKKDMLIQLGSDRRKEM